MMRRSPNPEFTDRDVFVLPNDLAKRNGSGFRSRLADALLGAAKTFGLVDLVLYVAVFFIATFRFVLFA